MERLIFLLSLLTKWFVPDAQHADDPQVRAAYGTLAGGLGIALNLLLFAIKLPVGLISRSMGIVSDAFNNLSDMGSSLISLIGMRMSAQRPDADHPFGHGRMEYIASLLVAVLIMVMGVELIRESVPALFDSHAQALSVPMTFVMGLSCLVKIYMMAYNRKIGRKIDAAVILAAAEDSRNDVIITISVIISALLRPHVNFPIDAIMGIAIALLILWSGYGIAKETIDQLLGGKPDRELADRISSMVLAQPGIVGLHDMILHDYGPGRTMASVHAEVPDDMDIHQAHELIDATELIIKRELGVMTVIHMDPIAVGNPMVDYARGQVERTLSDIDSRMSMHDFRMVPGKEKINLIFDVMMPFDMDQQSRSNALKILRARMQTIDPRYACVIQQDDDFLN